MSVPTTIRQRAALAVQLTESVDRAELVLAEALAVRALFVEHGILPGTYRIGDVETFPRLRIEGAVASHNLTCATYADGEVELTYRLSGTSLDPEVEIAERYEGEAEELLEGGPLAVLLHVGYFCRPSPDPVTERERSEAERAGSLLARALVAAFGYPPEAVGEAVRVEVERGDGSTPTFYKATFGTPDGGEFLMPVTEGEEPGPITYTAGGADDYETVETAADVAALDADAKGARS